MITAKPIISLFDRNFDHKILSSYRLSIRACSGGFSFSVKNIEESRFIGFEFYTLDPREEVMASDSMQLNQLLEYRPYLKESFGEVRWVSTKADNMFCPAALNVESNEKTHYAFNNDLAANSILNKDELTNLGVYNFYAIDQVMHDMLQAQWTNCPLSFRHQSSMLLKNLHIDFINKGCESLVYINISGRSFEVYVFDKYRFQLYNVFNFQSSEDFIYHLMNVYHQLSLKPDRVGLCLLGEIERQSELYRMAYRYIRNLSFLRFNSSFKMSYVFDQLSEHRFYAMFCE